MCHRNIEHKRRGPGCYDCERLETTYGTGCRESCCGYDDMKQGFYIKKHIYGQTQRYGKMQSQGHR